MADKTVHVQTGVGPMFLLFIVFLVLKLTGTITWSWLWVTAPLWGSLAIAGFFMVLFILAAVVAKLFS